MEKDRSTSQEFDQVSPNEADPPRREVLATISRFIYVAPSLALLAEPKGAQAGYGRSAKSGAGLSNRKQSPVPRRVAASRRVESLRVLVFMPGPSRVTSATDSRTRTG